MLNAIIFFNGTVPAWNDKCKNITKFDQRQNQTDCIKNRIIQFFCFVWFCSQFPLASIAICLRLKIQHKDVRTLQFFLFLYTIHYNILYSITTSFCSCVTYEWNLKKASILANAVSAALSSL